MTPEERAAIGALAEMLIAETLYQAGHVEGTVTISRARMEELARTHDIETVYDLNTGWTVTIRRKARPTNQGGM